MILSKNKVLLVDGDEGVRKSLSLFLQSRNYNLHAFENAAQALIELQKKDYDIILCEQFLSDMDGLKFFEAIANKYHGTIKILFTAYGNTPHFENITRDCIDYVLTKPFSGDEVEAIMSQLIKTKCVKNEPSCSEG